MRNLPFATAPSRAAVLSTLTPWYVCSRGFRGMRATQQLKYAIYGIFDLAYHAGDRPVPLQEIGARQGIPPRYLEQIFQRLRRAGLVRSKRGPGGGYLLALPPEDLRLADIVRAVQGSWLVVASGDDSKDSPSFVWDLLRASVRQALAERSIADLCREAAKRGVARADAEPAMYEI